MNEKCFENNQFLASLYSDAVQYALNQRFRLVLDRYNR